MSRRNQGTDLDDLRTSSDRSTRPEDKVDVYKFPKNTWVTLRIVGGIFTYGGYWVATKNNKGERVNFFKECPSYDPKIQDRDSTIYDPWRDAAERLNTKDNRVISFQKTAWANAIIRAEQKNEPKRKTKPSKEEAKTGLISLDSQTWTPVRALRLTQSIIKKIQGLRGLNIVESKKTGQSKAYPVTHPVFGCDIRIKFDPDADSPSNMYDVQIGNRKKLSKEEEEYLIWDLSELQDEVDEAEVKRDFESWAKRNGVKVNAKKSTFEDDEDDDDDDDDGFGDDGGDSKPAKKSKGKKPAKKSKKSKEVNDEEDFDEEEDEDEDEKPKKGKKAEKVTKKPKKSKASADEDEGDEDDSAWDDDEDEEAKPAKKAKGKPSKAKSKPSKKSKKEGTEFDDEDLDDEDLDDEEEEKPSKKSKGKAPKKSKKVEEDLEEDLDEEDDEEEEKPSKKSKGKAKKGKAPKKSKKASDEDDDWDDEDEDGDDWD